MPMYDYHCAGCGSFADFRPMAAYDEPAPCPECGAAAARVLLSVPHFAIATNRTKAQAVNEKSAHAPETSARTGRHPPSCGCCKSKPAAAKGFPAARPWMISH
jgi:putative FmdB family regulatory protein